MLSLVKTLLRWYLAVRADVEAVAALDRGDMAPTGGPPGMPAAVTHLCSYMSSFVDEEE